MWWKKGFFILFFLVGFSALYAGSHDQSGYVHPSSVMDLLQGQRLHQETASYQEFSMHFTAGRDVLRMQFREGNKRQAKSTEKRHKRTRESKAITAGRAELPPLLTNYLPERPTFFSSTLSFRDVIPGLLRGPPALV